MSTIFSSRLLLFISFISILIPPITAQPSFRNHVCSNKGNYSANSTYHGNLNLLLANLFSYTNIQYDFFNASYGQNPDRVNAIGLCRGDVKSNICHGCLDDARSLLPRLCPNQKEAIGWYNECMLRYSNRSIFGIVDNDPTSCLHSENRAINLNLFNLALRNLLERLKTKAASSSSIRNFATGDATGQSYQIYALVQCTPDLSEQECSDCIEGVISEIPNCHEGGIGVRIDRPSCGFMYDNFQFYYPNFRNHVCSNKGNYSANSTYHANLNLLLANLFSYTNIQYGFYNVSYGQNPDRVNAIGLCRGDVKPNICHGCLDDARALLPRLCPNQKETIGWYNNCMLRYSNRSIFGIVDNDPISCLHSENRAPNLNLFNLALRNLLVRLKIKAASSRSIRNFAYR
ncbi:Cysteine rich receptor like kinase [Quillaja saponaria]|uniref:Cysteine rich receptor like kinase n=1 Tax=Quillaja saponaria TaxID=32244 RepID=A0AAD7KUW5_QUISA|nr:Cysteine rich receptor like kinase [Quillaja saponaria]